MGTEDFIQNFKTFLDSPDHNLKKSPNTGAIISHYLHNNGIKPPLINRNDANRLKKTVHEYLLSQEKNDFLLVREDQLCLNLSGIPFPPPENPKFKFIDLFAGIGGFRIAFQALGGSCVFSSEWDKYAKDTYFRNFGEIPYGDIREIPENEIPEHDILCAGFPCQPFSLAGVSKKNSMGRKHGFEDETQGTLFFEIARILKKKRPKAFFLENVKNLLRHDNGNTFGIIKRTLESELGYVMNYKVVDAKCWVPQHRERIFIVGYNPKKISISNKDQIIIPEKPSDFYKYPELKLIIQDNVEECHTLGPGTWNTLLRHKEHHEKSGNGFGYGIHTVPIKKQEITRTISARYHKDGAEILIEQPGKRPRKLTVTEAMQLQGFEPSKFTFPVSNTQAYKQIGNSVAIPAIKETAAEIVKFLEENSIDSMVQRIR